MPASDPQNPYTAWSQLAVVILLAASALLLPPLISERPPPSGQGVFTRGVQSVDARLWQDPIGAVQNAAKKHADAVLQQRVACLGRVGNTPCATATTPALPLLAEVIAQRLAADRNRGVTVIFALIPGGAWVGADELRRRQRYAVLAALRAQHYAPDDPEHLGYVEARLDGAQLRLPFEWFSPQRRTVAAAPDDQTANALLVLWVDEENLSRDVPMAGSAAAARPLARLAALHKAVSEPEPGRLRSLILGPMSSTFLQAMAAEICARPDAAALRQLRDVPWYSAQATLPDTEIPMRCDHRNDGIANALPQFQRMTTTDDQLTARLVQELRARGVDENATIVLVSQWDTAYSRYFEGALRDAFQRAFGARNSLEVISASYLRGIDGVLVNSARSKPADSTGAETRDKTTAALERPEGEAQIDYLRRLAGQLLQERRALGRIAAIGIVGNDYHDKLLVLTALRPAFPEAVFFTTDLDAAMLHPHDNQHTRNLVVAAPFGLHTGVQNSPPFRDNYQTANYWAVRVALDRLEERPPPVAEYRRWLRPQLFEIGRLSPIPLPLPDADGPVCAATPAGTGIRCADIAPATTAAPGIRSMLLAPLLILLGGAFAIVSGQWRRQWLPVWGGLVALAALAALGLAAATRATIAEPFSWLEGVSIWPSEILRLIALALSIGLLLLARARLKTTAAIVEQRYGLRIDDTGISTRQPDVRQIWRLYCRPWENPRLPSILRWPTHWRIALSIALLLVFVLMVAATLGFEPPGVPLRGSAAAVADKLVLYPTLLAFQVLLFFVLEQIWRTVWLAAQLRGRSLWPDQSLLSHLRDAGHSARKHWQRFVPRPKPGQPIAPARDPHVYDDWLDCQLIATATVPVQNMIFYPFAILALLLLARSSLFDRWTLPPILLLAFGASLLLMVIGAVALRKTAEGVRAEALRWLHTHLVDARGRRDDALAAQLEHLVQQTNALDTGAFAPISQQPLFRAAITVFGSLSGIKLLEYLSIANV